jgi:methylated-DNA-[protein]-cysteine S-methyltransferase
MRIVVFKFIYLYHGNSICKKPLSTAKIVGDESGIAILVQDEGKLGSDSEVLQECVMQIEAYFEGKRNYFSFKMNPKGTEFQQKVWKSLIFLWKN